MRLAAQHPVTSREIKGDGMQRFVNDELLKVLRAVRSGVNALNPERHVARTDGQGTYVRIWQSDELPTNCMYSVVADVVGVTALGYAAERAHYRLVGSFQAITAVAQVGGTTTVHSYESAAGINARFGVDATARAVYLEVRDNGGDSVMQFTAVITQNEGLQA